VTGRVLASLETRIRRFAVADAGERPVGARLPLNQPPQLSPIPRDAVAVTAIDGTEHLVLQFALAERWRDGWYPTWCGTWVAGASMCEPPGKPCRLCACAAIV
jgi:hypothetical protein